MRKGRDIREQENARDSLRVKYREICKKYKALVHRVGKDRIERIGVYQLGWWALRTTASALALVRSNKIYLCNNRWREIDREGVSGWEAISGASSGAPATAHATLLELALAEARQLQRGESSRVTRYHRLGGTQVFEVRGERLTGPRAIALLLHDVTVEARAENELHGAREALHERHRMQSIGEVASGVAHDLNNVLNVMRLRLFIIQSRPADDAHAAQLASLSRIIEDAAARVARMQDLSRKQAEETFEPVDLRQVIDESVELAG